MLCLLWNPLTVRENCNIVIKKCSHNPAVDLPVSFHFSKTVALLKIALQLSRGAKNQKTGTGGVQVQILILFFGTVIFEQF